MHSWRLRVHPEGVAQRSAKLRHHDVQALDGRTFRLMGLWTTPTARHDAIREGQIRRCRACAVTPTLIRRSTCSCAQMRAGCSDAYRLLRIQSAVTRGTECRTLADHSLTLRESPHPGVPMFRLTHRRRARRQRAIQFLGRPVPEHRPSTDDKVASATITPGSNLRDAGHP